MKISMCMRVRQKQWWWYLCVITWGGVRFKRRRGSSLFILWLELIWNKNKIDTHCRNDKAFVDEEAIVLCCWFSLINNISTGVVVVLLITISLIVVDIKQLRRRIFDAVWLLCSVKCSKVWSKMFRKLKVFLYKTIGF